MLTTIQLYSSRTFLELHVRVTQALRYSHLDKNQSQSSRGIKITQNSLKSCVYIPRYGMQGCLTFAM